jgi:hypothetical protein
MASGGEMRREDKAIHDRDEIEAIIRGSLACRLALSDDNRRREKSRNIEKKH